VPTSQYYGGKGRQVMRDMKRRYGSEKGERVFYAVKNKHKASKGRVVKGDR
jgi:hypothetical protein